MALSVGNVLQNRYRIVSLLGQGGMGAVYQAWNVQLDVPLALKEMTSQPGLDERTLSQLSRQFQREAQVLARLDHPHLVRVTDFFEEGGNAYLVMNFVEGESLDDRIESEGALSEAQVLGWADQLLDALEHCHNQGVIHRDVKPPNVIIRPSGEAVLVDFGLVKLWDPHDPHTKTVVQGLGTPHYAPPEQYDLESGHTDIRSDIYGLGATLYHALTAEAPPTATQRIVQPTVLVPVRTLSPGVSLQVEMAVTRALELQPAARFQTATEMREMLAGESIPLKERDRRIETTVDTSDTRSVRTRAIPATRVAKRKRTIPDWMWALGILGMLVVIGGIILLLATTGGLKALTSSRLSTVAEASTTTPHLPTVTMTPTPSPAPTATPTVSPMPPHALANAPAPIDTWTRPVDGMVMVYIPTEEFEMGSDDDDIDHALQLCNEYPSSSHPCDREYFEDEQPVHTVKLDGFWIDRTEVTNAQYRRCVREEACNPPAQNSSHTRDSYYDDSAYDRYPVVYVSWHQAVDYCAWAEARLPTEAEWEYAARGPGRYALPWGDEFDGTRLNYCDTNCAFFWADGSTSDGYADTAPAGSYLGGASWCGALDLAGNVWEWVSDWYDGSFYSLSPSQNPTGPSSGEHRVLRGGSWYDEPRYMLSTYRLKNPPDFAYHNRGFRCARDHNEPAE
jgi:formylglycine-generating enzyme required for sulfatase activity